MAKVPRILVVSPNYHDGTSFYRCAGPLTQLQREGKVDLVFDDSGAWPTLKLVDLIFFQRPQSKTHYELLSKAVDMNLPVWVDYDDLLTAVPESNPGHLHYLDPNTQQIIAAFIKNASVLTVSTDYLADLFGRERSLPIVVIPNAWDDQLYPNKLEARNKAIMWRGSNTHDADLYSVKSSLQAIDILKPDWHFIGNPFWLVVQDLHKSHTYPWTDLLGFQKTLEHVSATTAIVPLTDCPFNRAKSNIAWIEATRVGAAVVAPNWAEWSMPGICTYETIGGFKTHTEHLWMDSKWAKEKNKESWDYIKENLRLTEVNKWRFRLIKDLL